MAKQTLIITLECIDYNGDPGIIVKLDVNGIMRSDILSETTALAFKYEWSKITELGMDTTWRMIYPEPQNHRNPGRH